ncbi:MAG: hypothetical protein K8F34_10560 [Candidatus Kuenenia stuttgartiensis]|uniref:Uncharacterized protein n=1 Tax=Kuenenia stuttgartiensis TaxID=174633 RepID=A0A2C9CJT6_KUEST|nr:MULTISPECIES: hypothetical protein [Kuenenia]MBZ0192115.1 hypothetical protein [Candidatus Kuenenia stuttgartiensis]MCL4728020.1 hypothetical protein [Candidatus Kuenenia stuttgartiensis]MCZ7622120.1 hypothetical protein [Candidatus Kuenenia sp.]SOH06179.1 hypothetical protein KSMBR1_3706 [Candidatus Kuenenia stuttgartiensis]GJQ48395.1 MAG: hypothetical protein HKUEN01_07810 [Candidatus Kuenenia stuttgartiensis]
MSAILKENVLQEKSRKNGSKGKVEKIMDTIIKKPTTKTVVKEVTEKEQDSVPKSTVIRKYIFSNEILIEGENIDDLNDLRAIIDKEFKPSNEIESFFADRIVSSIWRMKRCLNIEKQIIEHASSGIQEYEQGFFTSKKRTKNELQQLKALKIIEEKDKMSEIMKYESSLERQFYLALRELRKAKRIDTKQTTKTQKKTK